MTIQTAQTIHKKALHLNQIGEEFTLIKINNTLKLQSKYYGNISSQGNKKIPPMELGFIRRVKNHILKHQIYANFISNFYYPEDIDYVSIMKHDKTVKIDNVIEIDIDEAYWKTAHILNVLSDHLYEEGRKSNGKISKLGRLISLGSLAKKKIIYYFKGSRLMKKETQRSLTTENIWYSICKRLSDVMNEAREIAGKDFIMYWVDGIYIKNEPELVEKIRQSFTKYGYDVKFRDNLSVKYTKDRVYIQDKTTNKERSFFIPKKDIRKSFFSDPELKEVALKYSNYVSLNDNNIEP